MTAPPAGSLCSGCAFWDTSASKPTGEARPAVWGLCRVNPPITAPQVTSVASMVTTTWPQTLAGDWCGEWVAAGGGGGSGVTDGSDAAAGDVGEYVAALLGQGSAVTLPNAVDTQVMALTMTAGDWDVWGELWVTKTGAGNLTSVKVALSPTVSATMPDPVEGADIASEIGFSSQAGSTAVLGGLRARASLTAAAVYYLVANPVYGGGGAVTAWGAIRARRVR